MNQSHQLARAVFISTATAPLSEEELQRLARGASARNQARSITGVLCYNAGDFLQLVEGDEDSVTGLLDAIARDPRHAWMQVLLHAPANRRLYSAWCLTRYNLHSDASSSRSEFRVIAAFLERCPAFDSEIVAVALLNYFTARDQLQAAA